MSNSFCRSSKSSPSSHRTDRRPTLSTLRYVLASYKFCDGSSVSPRLILRKHWRDLPSRMLLPRTLLLHRHWYSYLPQELFHICSIIRTRLMLHGVLLAHFLLQWQRVREGPSQLDPWVAQQHLHLLHQAPRMVSQMSGQSLQLLCWLVCQCCWLHISEYIWGLALDFYLIQYVALVVGLSNGPVYFILLTSSYVCAAWQSFLIAVNV